MKLIDKAIALVKYKGKVLIFTGSEKDKNN